jgi:SAM-dependent methyltransferase
VAEYDALAGVYDWLVPEPMLTPEGSVAAFADVVDTLATGARVLDCASGTGQLAVGLALRGFEVVACDASPAMVERTQTLAGRHRADLRAATCEWEDLPAHERPGSFDAVFCVGNSLTHAAGVVRRRAALRAMAGALRADGLLVLTSRNWERVRAAGSGLRVAERLVERSGEQAVVIHAWTIADGWDDRHCLDVAVARLDRSRPPTTTGSSAISSPLDAGSLPPGQTARTRLLRASCVSSTRPSSSSRGGRYIPNRPR